MIHECPPESIELLPKEEWPSCLDSVIRLSALSYFGEVHDMYLLANKNASGKYEKWHFRDNKGRVCTPKMCHNIEESFGVATNPLALLDVFNISSIWLMILSGKKNPSNLEIAQAEAELWHSELSNSSLLMDKNFFCAQSEAFRRITRLLIFHIQEERDSIRSCLSALTNKHFNDFATSKDEKSFLVGMEMKKALDFFDNVTGFSS